jgi:hypothetical protein
MKKLAFALTVLIILVVMISADIDRSTDGSPATVALPKKPCYGYTIIEFGKGINCSGDTVKLVKVNGGQQLMVQEEIGASFTAKN